MSFKGGIGHTGIQHDALPGQAEAPGENPGNLE
jgi:hypothetical protein